MRKREAGHHQTSGSAIWGMVVSPLRIGSLVAGPGSGATERMSFGQARGRVGACGCARPKAQQRGLPDMH